MTLSIDFFKNIDLKSLNTLTKYPSIPTYHQITGQKTLLPNLTEGIDFDGKELHISEKIDGENTRLVFFSDGVNTEFLVGSREELLFCSVDGIIPNKENQQVRVLKPVAERIQANFTHELRPGILAMYFEVYGGKVQNAKQYTSTQRQAHLLFDVFSLSGEQYFELLAMPIVKIARWRDNNNQPYYDIKEKTKIAQTMGLPEVPIYDATIPIPKERIDTYLYLKNRYWDTRAGIDNKGKAEGIVVRTPDRKMIAKLRFEDYEKSFRREEIMDGNNNFRISVE